MSSQWLPKNIHSCRIRGHDQSSQLCLAYTVWSVNFVFSKISYVLIRIWWGPDDRMRWAHLSKHSAFCDMRCFLVRDVIFRDWMQNSQHNENFHCERVVCSANHLTFVIIERPHGMWCAWHFALCWTTSFSSRVLVFFKVPENSTFHVRMGSMGCSLMPPPEKVSSSSLINLAMGSQFPLNKSPCGVYRRKVVLATSNLFPSTKRQNS